MISPLLVLYVNCECCYFSWNDMKLSPSYIWKKQWLWFMVRKMNVFCTDGAVEGISIAWCVSLKLLFWFGTSDMLSREQLRGLSNQLQTGKWPQTVQITHTAKKGKRLQTVFDTSRAKLWQFIDLADVLLFCILLYHISFYFSSK